MIIFFLEISDKVIPVSLMYGFALGLGGIGLLLGWWRWKLGLVWLIFPHSLLVLGHMILHVAELDALHRDIIRELGQSYIWHSWISPVMGLG